MEKVKSLETKKQRNSSNKSVSTVKDTGNKINTLLSIENLWNQEIENFSSFVDFQLKLNTETNKFFEEEIRNESNEFKNVLTKSITSNTFKWYKAKTKAETNSLKKLLTRKKEVYLGYFLGMLNTWKLDKILCGNDVKTLQIIIKSGFIQFLDSLFLKNDAKFIQAYEKPEKQVYGFLKKDLTETSFAWNNEAKFEEFKKQFQEIPNENIRNYLIWFIDLSLAWNTNYDDYIELERFALNTWDNNSKLGFMHPLENYELPGYTDLEFSLVLKDVSEWVDNSKYYSELFIKYFWNDYHAKEISVFDVEKFFSLWNASYMSVLGQAFPNDVNSKKEYWNKITIYNSNIRKSIEENYSIAKKVISNLPNLDESTLTSYDSDFVIAHEFAHSLFRNWYKSEFEEAKASFWYLLKLHYQFEWKEISLQEQEYIITNLLIEIIKQTRRDWIASYKQYILYAKMALASLINLWVLKVEWKEISIIYDENNFRDFLKSWLESLNLLKNIYENEEKESEEKIIKLIEENIDEIYQIILEKVNKNVIQRPERSITRCNKLKSKYKRRINKKLCRN